MNKRDFYGSEGEKFEGNTPFRKVGGKIVFNGRTVKGCICYSYRLSLFAMHLSAEFPWERDNNVVYNVCPERALRTPLSSRSDA